MNTNERSDLAAALLIERLVRESYTERAPGAVTPLQWAILRAVKRCGDDGCTQNWIASFVGVTPAPVNRAVKALQRNEAVNVCRDTTDGRKTIITLTSQGLELLDKDPIFSITDRLNRLESSEKKAFRKTLQQLFIDAHATAHS